MLYAGLMTCLDDDSSHVRAVMASELIRSDYAPRPVILALAQDIEIISHAVLQHSPILLDADLVDLAAIGGQGAVHAVALRTELSVVIAAALVEIGDERAICVVLDRGDIDLVPISLYRAAERFVNNGKVRALLLARQDLPGDLRARLALEIRQNLLGSKLVTSCVGAKRMARRLEASLATSQLENADCWDDEDRMQIIEEMRESGDLNTKILLRALVFGHFNFLESALYLLSNVPPARLATLFVHGSSNAVEAMLRKAGLSPVLADIFARGVLLSRGMDVENSASARHNFLSQLLDDILVEHDHDLPEEFSATFSYLSQLNLEVGRAAARQILLAVAPRLKQLSAA